MTAGSYRASRQRSDAESDPGRSLALAMAGVGCSGLLAIVMLLSGGGFLTAFLVYVVAGSIIVPLLAVAPLARADGRRFGERRALRHPSRVEVVSPCMPRAG